jgi:hypothetical protein
MQSTLLRILALLIAFRGLGNVLKPLGTGSGIVALGKLLPPTSLLAPAVGLYMIVYAVGLWQGRRFALATGVLYALWATLNIVLFPIVEGLPPRIAPWMYAIYGVGGVALPWAAVWLLRQRLRS